MINENYDALLRSSKLHKSEYLDDHTTNDSIQSANNERKSESKTFTKKKIT